MADEEITPTRSQLYGYCRRRYLEDAWDDQRLTECVNRNYITQEEKDLIVTANEVVPEQ